MRGRCRFGSSWIGGLLLVGCAGGGVSGGQPLSRCEPVQSESIDESALSDLAGEYGVLFVTSTGEVADARMHLVAAKGALRRMTGPDGVGTADILLPYYGTISLDVTEVGGVTAGSPMSADSLSPGVLVVQQNRPGVGPSLTLRIGSEANARGRSRFDGAYFAMRVRELTQGRIAGSWASGSRMETASGHFCAFRR